MTIKSNRPSWERRTNKKMELTSAAVFAAALFAIVYCSVGLSNYDMDNNNESIRRLLKENTTTVEKGWVRPDVVFGLVHIAKTAGSTINGALAVHFERVCGNKGFSFDAALWNHESDPEKELERLTSHGHRLLSSEEESLSSQEDSMPAKEERTLLTGQHTELTSVEDCDYVAEEMHWEGWSEFSQQWPMELHVPCRDPLEHLMSQCNFKNKKLFRCDALDLEEEVQNCLVHTDSRFSSHLQDDPNISLKCFNPIPVEDYIKYMGTILEHKRIDSEYFSRPSNTPRNKEEECLWSAGEDFQAKVLSVLMKHEYYAFCEQCLGTDQELSLSSSKGDE